MKCYSAKAIANAFLELAESEGAKIEPMKMQKLVYIAHGWALGLMGEPLIREDVQAWKYGPVIQDLYHEFKRYGRDPIVHRATDIHLDHASLKLIEDTPEVSPEDSDAHALIEKVWEVYSKFSGPQLSNITHMSGTPWDTTFNGEHQRVIDNEVIKHHYQELSNKRAG
ncbi:Panacea domain-containing protein [Vibrio parahaemolyticus]|uniref:Panacea domain-containing protein n=1 Tax=Vibrio parahaemolyticus TaxID=670 RepID=UPI00235FD9D5|nr:type II toxin-antitoxin system antitoxin SocA domain-containing protein [Vibrio parahaemolyticus]